MKEITHEAVVAWLPVRPKNSYKGDMGRVLCLGGSYGMGGAIILAAQAALHSGAGLVSVATDSRHFTALLSRNPEIMTCNWEDEEELLQHIRVATSIVVGPGLGQSKEAAGYLRLVMQEAKREQTLIIDADAINLISADKTLGQSQANLLYTPHIGEWQRLGGRKMEAYKTESDFHQANLTLAAALNACVVLKGAPSQVYYQDAIWQNTTGNPSQAVGGMGDVLAGVIAGFTAQAPGDFGAILSALFLHSYIADQLSESNYVTLPSQIIANISSSMKSLVMLKQASPKQRL